MKNVRRLVRLLHTQKRALARELAAARPLRKHVAMHTDQFRRVRRSSQRQPRDEA